MTSPIGAEPEDFDVVLREAIVMRATVRAKELTEGTHRYANLGMAYPAIVDALVEMGEFAQQVINWHEDLEGDSDE